MKSCLILSRALEVCICHKLKFFNPYTFATRWYRSLLEKLLYQRLTPSGYTDIGIIIFELVAKIHFLRFFSRSFYPFPWIQFGNLYDPKQTKKDWKNVFKNSYGVHFYHGSTKTKDGKHIRGELEFQPRGSTFLFSACTCMQEKITCFGNLRY